MSAYADKIAMEVLEADLRAGSRGLEHPPLEWHKAVALARAVSNAPITRPEELSATPDPFLLEVCEELFGCHVSPGRNEYGESEYRCALCEEKIDIGKWVTAEHADSCLINRVRNLLAEHKPKCVPGFTPSPQVRVSE